MRLLRYTKDSNKSGHEEGEVTSLSCGQFALLKLAAMVVVVVAFLSLICSQCALLLEAAWLMGKEQASENGVGLPHFPLRQETSCPQAQSSHYCLMEQHEQKGHGVG